MKQHVKINAELYNKFRSKGVITVWHYGDYIEETWPFSAVIEDNLVRMWGKIDFLEEEEVLITDPAVVKTIKSLL